MGRELSDAGASRAEISAVDIVLSIISNNNNELRAAYNLVTKLSPFYVRDRYSNTGGSL